MNSAELRQRRAALADQALAIITEAQTAGRDLTGEERQKYDKIMADVDAMKGDIDRLERAEELTRELAGKQENRPGQPEDRGIITREPPEFREAFQTWIRSGAEGLSDDQRRIMAQFRAQNEARESRALSAITGAAGGYTVPQGFLATIVDAMKWFGGMRQSRATTLNTTSGNDLPIPTANDTAVVGELVGENTAVTAADIAFAQVMLKAYKYSSKTVLVPFELLQDSGVDIEAYIGRKLGERIGRITNTHFTTGDGVNKPRGVVTDATLGKTGTTGQTTSIIYDDLVDLVHAVDVAYRPNSQFMFNDSTLKALKKLKDSQQRPLWVPGLAVKEPDTINGYPYIVNNDVAAMAANAKSVLFGDFSAYYIRNVMDILLYRIVDKYIESGQVGFLAFYRGDGRLVDAGMHPIAYYANSAT